MRPNSYHPGSGNEPASVERKYKLWIVLGITVLFLGIIGIMWVSASNKEVKLRNAIAAKQRDNTNEFDNLWKTIKKTAQVDEKARETLKDILVSHAAARTTGGSKDGAFMKWVNESVPNADLTTTKNLMNIIVSSHDAWKTRQKELLDLKREHDNAIDSFPSSIFVGGRGKIDVQIITSSRTEETFRTGKDEDMDVFEKKSP